MRLSRSDAHKRAVELLTQVRIPDPARALKKYPYEFSGGMRQRIAIAMALACSPRLLIADEPTTALDVTVQAGILRLIDELRHESGLAVLLITHDLGVLSALADRLYVFYGGRVVETGSTRDLIGQPRHPYTKALLDAVPHPTTDGAPSKGIPGAPPRPGQWPQGCIFQPRCAFAQDVCRAKEPPLETVGDDRRLRCVIDPFVPVYR
jgi:oligopeptide/dipeptide ABC transporter ATP-binding protein